MTNDTLSRNGIRSSAAFSSENPARPQQVIETSAFMKLLAIAIVVGGIVGIGLVYL